ncbi:FAD-binding oxidoreductase [Thiohalobacter thiocyanaticus]|uniref:Flavodoxin reductase n=1 Tax=Thiohalobacter thiocyanaticus TaxID=585455 RepID=A0A426QFJ0_9GAMM|nr:FAD-binding oxidoreductase [Thiohalobacter thiocyanaticus]RRQ20542.1 flavodoxin reductase [Thiohalobacter thiocyanaticus]
MDYSATLLMTGFVTHDVKRYVLEWPRGLEYQPGQGVELRIDEPGWRKEGRPFTPTSVTGDRVLEFTIKTYPEHAGMTRQLHTQSPGVKLLLSEPFGTIQYKGPGVFIAAGAGVTPFLAIVRDLAGRGELGASQLLFSNKTPADVICERELRHYFGDRAWFTCTQDSAPGYADRRIDRELLQERISDFGQNFYVCGPPGFTEAVNQALTELGADPDAVVFEQ